MILPCVESLDNPRPGIVQLIYGRVQDRSSARFRGLHLGFICYLAVSTGPLLLWSFLA